MVAIKWSDVKSNEYHDLSIAMAATVPNVEDEETILLFDDDDDSNAVQYNLQMEGHDTDDGICDDSTESESDIDNDDDDRGRWWRKSSCIDNKAKDNDDEMETEIVSIGVILLKHVLQLSLKKQYCIQTTMLKVLKTFPKVPQRSNILVTSYKSRWLRNFTLVLHFAGIMLEKMSLLGIPAQPQQMNVLIWL